MTDLSLDRERISKISDVSLATRIRTLKEVVDGYDSREGPMWEAAIQTIGTNDISIYRSVLRTLRAEKRRRDTNSNARVPEAEWTPFARTYANPADFSTPEAMERYNALAANDKSGRTAEDYHQLYLASANDEMWRNSRYQVAARRNYTDDGEGGIVEMVHLSIKRIDGQTIHDWRDKQRIKTELLGAECEAIELYPAESRLIDTANQYHLWGVNSTTFRWPVGWHEGRLTLDPNEADVAGAHQRPFER